MSACRSGFPAYLEQLQEGGVLRAEKPINSSNRRLHYIGHHLRGHTGYPDGDGDSETRPTAWRLTRECQVYTLLATCFLETPSRRSALGGLDDKLTISMGLGREWYPRPRLGHASGRHWRSYPGCHGFVLSGSRPITTLAGARYKTTETPAAPACSNSPRFSDFRTGLAIFISML